MLETTATIFFGAVGGFLIIKSLQKDYWRTYSRNKLIADVIAMLCMLVMAAAAAWLITLGE